MEEEGEKARQLGEQAGEVSRGVLPVIGDTIEGFWDGLRQLPADETTDAYLIAYDAGSMVPDVLAAIWEFTVGFFQGLFG